MSQDLIEKKAPKRLLIVSQHFWPENFRITDIAEGFTEAGIEVDVLCGLPNYPKGEWFEGYRYTGPRREEYKGIQVFRCGEIRRKGNTALRIFLNYISFPFFSLFNFPRLAKRKYDAVFCYETSPVMMMLPAIVYAKTHKIPLTTYVLDLWPDNLYSVLPINSKPLRWIVQKISNWHYRRSTRLIGMSNALADRLQLLYGTGKKAPSVAMIQNYCEDFYAQVIHSSALQERFEGFFTILFAGNFSPAQDLENLVQAVRLVKEKGTAAHKLRCLLVGDGMSRTSLEEYIKEQEVAEFFEFCGAQPPEDIPKWTNVADVLFAGLLKSENLGLTVPAKITSYFAAGRPLLVAADGEAARVALQSGASFVSAASNPQELCDNILRMIHLSDLERKQLGENGREYYKQHFRRDILLKQLQDYIFDGIAPK